MKFSLLILILVVSCSKPSGSSKSKSSIPDRVVNTDSVVDIADPLVSGDNQQQDDGDFQLERNYNGVNVVLNHNSSRRLGMIRIRDKDAKKLHKHMALSTIKLQSQFVKNDLEAKVGKHIMCRQDTCWAYIDYMNGDVIENKRVSEAAKAFKLGINYRGKNLDLVNDVDLRDAESFPLGRIHFEGMDAKALYSVMALAEVDTSRKGSVTSRKAGNGVSCTRSTSEKADGKTIYKCKLEFNHRSGAVKDIQD